MDWQTLDREIEALDSLSESANNSFLMDREDSWALVWTKSNAIQQAFNSNVFYPSKLDRDNAWAKFNIIRNKAREHYGEYRRFTSNRFYSEILDHLKHAHHDFVSELFDKTLFAFAPTSKENMIAKGASLTAARRLLSANKARMLFEHKDACYSRIIEIQKDHDAWWGRWKEAAAARTAEWEARQERRQKHQERTVEFKSRLASNLATNRSRLETAQAALASMEESESNLETKIATAWNDEWKESAEGRLEGLRSKMENTREYISRLEQWITKDEDTLSEL